MTTTYLGQFTDENAELVTAALEEAGIGWSAKSSGGFSRLVFAADWGVRLFVDAADLDAARDVAGAIAPDGLARRRRR